MSLGVKILLVAVGYLLGSIPFGLVLARAKGIDPRKVGSGNIGASNVTRSAGKGLGAATLVLDAVKASIPMLVTRALLRDDPHAETWVVVVGLAAFLGHVYPVWLKFRGGKGVATALGVFLVLAPVAALVAFAAFAIAFATTRVAAVGSLAGTFVCTAGVFLLHGAGSPVPWVALVIALFIVWRHRSNLERLVRGAENKIP
jgi:acyl phosphate:glycerol-3-phosphate acyltransferase